MRMAERAAQKAPTPPGAIREREAAQWARRVLDLSAADSDLDFFKQLQQRRACLFHGGTPMGYVAIQLAQGLLLQCRLNAIDLQGTL